MDAQVSLLVFSSSLSEEQIGCISNIKPTKIGKNKEGKTMWIRRTGDIEIESIEASIVNFLSDIRTDVEGIDARQVWLRIDSKTGFAGFALSKACVKELASYGVDLFVSAYCEGIDAGDA